jgi:hypothetical protein
MPEDEDAKSLMASDKPLQLSFIDAYRPNISNRGYNTPTPNTLVTAQREVNTLRASEMSVERNDRRGRGRREIHE